MECTMLVRLFGGADTMLKGLYLVTSACANDAPVLICALFAQTLAAFDHDKKC